MKQMLSLYRDAEKRFSPKVLMDYLARDDNGVVYVDREAAIAKDGDDSLFAVTLAHDYLWDYKDYENSTIYFESSERYIVGGVYNLRLQRIITRRVIVESVRDCLPVRYNVSQNTLEKMRSIIQST